MADSIAAVVVTYNRKVLLGECLNALLRQTRPLDSIFVIDNASSDGTAEFLEKNGLLRETRIRYVRLPENTGGAGGFCEGMKRAFEAGFDWFWLMDDDVEPYLDGLERLYQFSAEGHCIHGRRNGIDGTPLCWGEWFDPNRVVTRPIKDPGFSDHQRWQEVNVACFEGMLIARDVVAKIGYPCQEFFITWDDMLYGFLASQVTKVVYANVFSLKKKRPVETVRVYGLGRRVALSPLAAYYYQRNRFLIARKLHTMGVAFFLSTIYGVSRTLARDCLRGDFARLSGTLRGFLDGLRGATG